MSGNFLSCSEGVKDLLELPEFSVINPYFLSRNGPHLAWRGEPPGFSRVAAGALDLLWGPQGPALVASGKASPHASCSGASRGPLGFPLPLMLGPKTLCGVSAGT